MIFIIVFFCIVLLVLCITLLKLNAFIAFLMVSVVAGLLLGIPMPKIVGSVQKGMGDTLGSLVIIIVLGAMFGKLVAESGAAQKIAAVLMNTFGERYVQWAFVLTGFIIGIPLFYGVGFVLMVPLIFSVVYQYKLPAVYIGLPMLSALSVTHGFLPPHPSPVALASQFHADIGTTLLYGIVIAIPAIIIAGPLFSLTVKNIKSVPLRAFQPKQLSNEELPGTFNSFLTSLLPVILLIIAALLPLIIRTQDTKLQHVIALAGSADIVMLISLLVAACTLGLAMKKTMKEVMEICTGAVKDIGMILLIIAGAGALKQIFTDSGVNNQIAAVFQTWNIHPLVLAWLIAAIIRVCIGSATIAGLTAAGIIAPLIVQAHVNPSLMVLSVGAGSLMFSHVNDTGFWMFKEYFNLSIKDTLRSWSLMETIVSVVGLAGVLLLNNYL